MHVRNANRNRFRRLLPHVPCRPFCGRLCNFHSCNSLHCLIPNQSTPMNYTKTIPLETSAFNSRNLNAGQWVSLGGKKLQFVRRAFDGTLWLQDKGLPVNYTPGKALVFSPKSNNKPRKVPSRFARNLQVCLAGVALVALVNVIFSA